MLEKVRNFLGLGKANAATLIRDIIKGHESQAILFEAGNEHVLAAYVEFGHKFSPLYVCEFLETADSKLVKTYLEMGFELDDKAKETVLARKDGELSRAMMDSGSWAPFPFGGCVHPDHQHHDLAIEAEIAGAAAIAGGGIVPA